MNQNKFDRLFPRAFAPGIIEPFMHKGEWAIHEVLPFLLLDHKKADITIATFNISEESLRPLFFLVEEEKIKSLTLLLDITVKRHKLDMLLFAANITTNIRINNNHAKILLVENEKLKFGIVGSANLNENHRWESGFYFTDISVFEYFKKEFEKAYNESIPFEWN
jgi:hypothetical protein